MKYKVFSDGASKGNPGPAGAGFAVYNEGGELIHQKSIPLGNTTNNIAEYSAIIEGAKYAQSLRPAQVDFYLDSELIVKQISGAYKVKAEHLLPYYKELMLILSGLKATVTHVPREQNKVADKLANEGVLKN